MAGRIRKDTIEASTCGSEAQYYCLERELVAGVVVGKSDHNEKSSFLIMPFTICRSSLNCSVRTKFYDVPLEVLVTK